MYREICQMPYLGPSESCRSVHIMKSTTDAVLFIRIFVSCQS